MKDLQEKAVKLLETLQNGQLKVEIDASSGTTYINGIEFTIPEQQQFMEKYGDVPTFKALLKELNDSPVAKKLRSAITYEGGMFKVDMDKMKDVFKIDLSDNGIFPEPDTTFPTDRPNVSVTFPYPYSGISMNDLVAQKANKVNEETKKANDVNKDARIAELEQKLAQAEKKIAELAKQLQSTEQEKLSEKDLKFPQHFKKVDKNTSKVVTIGDVQKIIDELKELEVPYGSFVLARVGNVAVLKIHDDQGISYLVTTDFYQAHLG
jgi:uncharacterized coiled-coil protein SlyX